MVDSVVHGVVCVLCGYTKCIQLLTVTSHCACVK